MNRSKKLCILLGIFAAICVATFAVMQMEGQKEQIKATGEIILEVSADDVSSLKWEYGATALAFHKDGETWLYDEDEAFPVDAEKIENLLSQFESFGVSFAIEDVTDESLYGLDSPECVIEFAAEGQTYTIKVGDYSKMDEERYVSIGDGNVYLAKVDPLEKFDAVLDDLMRHDQGLSYDEVTGIAFRGSENYTIFRDEDNVAADCDADVYFTEKDGETLPLDTSRVESFLESLTTLNLTDYVTYNATEEELEGCNLTDPELTITVDYTADNGAEETYILSISRNAEELAAAEEAEANGEAVEDVTAYVRIGDSPIIYRVSEYQSNNLRAVSYNDLRHREVLAADFEDVTQIDITLEDSDYTILTDDKKDGERIWTYGEDEIDIDDLQDALEDLKVTSSANFTSEQPTGKREIGLTVYLEHETRPTVQIDLYRQDGDHCLAVVDGVPMALVSRSDVVELVEAVNSIVLN